VPQTEYLLWRQPLDDGETTTVYAVRHPIRSTRVRVVFFPAPRRLDVACRAAAVEEAVVGGFFVRDPYRPLGEVWADGRADPSRAAARDLRAPPRVRGQRRCRRADRRARRGARAP
jgi:hypothetical protein